MCWSASQVKVPPSVFVQVGILENPVLKSPLSWSLSKILEHGSVLRLAATCLFLANAHGNESCAII